MPQCLYVNDCSIEPSEEVTLLGVRLEIGRQRQIAIQTFKIVNNLSPPYLQNLITPRKCTRIPRNFVKTKEIPFYNRVRHGTNLFSFLAPKIWNNLPEEISAISDLPSFRKAIATWSIHNNRLELNFFNIYFFFRSTPPFVQGLWFHVWCSLSHFSYC